MNRQSQWKRFGILLAVIALVAAVIAGCAGSNKDAEGSPSASQPSANSGSNAPAPSSESPKAEEPLALDIMLPIFKTNYPKDGSPVVAELEKRTNTKIHLEWVPNASYTDKFNITLASGNLPSIIYVPDVKSSSFVNAAKSGAFWDVGPYLQDYEYLKQANPVILNNSSVEGANYGVYRGRALGRNGIVFRKDWLDKVGLQTPQTVDDFYNMLKAFKEQDPDGNNKADTYGMVLVKWTGGWASGFDIMKLWFGSPNKWGERDGKLVHEALTPEYLEALKFMKKLYDEKLINQDFAVYDSAKWNDPIINNQAGVIVDVADGAARIDDKIHAALAKEGKDNPDIHYMDVIGGVKGSDGELHALPTSGFAGMLAFPKSTVKTEEELKRVLAFIDKLNEPDLETLLTFGLEGKHYTEEDGAAVPSKDSVLLESEVEGLNQMLTFIPAAKGLLVKQTELRKKQTQVQIDNEQFVVANPAEPFISEVYSQKGPQLDNIINDARIKFIVGQIDEAGFQEALEVWKKSGGSDLMDEMNKLYAAAKK